MNYSSIMTIVVILLYISFVIKTYLSPLSISIQQWQQDEDGMMRPVTRLKKNIERNPNYWDKVFTDDE